MLRTTYKWYCDACGKEINGDYKGHIEVKRYREEDDDYLTTTGMDFCKDCMISFNEWRESRKQQSEKPKCVNTQQPSLFDDI